MKATTNTNRFQRYGDSEELRQLASSVRTAAVYKSKPRQKINADTLARWEPLRPLLTKLAADHRYLWQIATALNELRVSTAAGCDTWHSTTVLRALRVLGLRR